MILASNSPRRKEILESVGFELKIISSNIEEKSTKIDLKEKVKDIAYQKAMCVAENNRKEFILAADTIVELDGIVLGKPKTEDEIYNYLRMLSGKTHRVITAYSFINIEKELCINVVVENQVEFYDISEEEIKWYIESGEPFDKAGAYGIQGKGRVFVREIKGDFYAIMGFPISHFLKTLNKLGYKISDINKI